MSLEIRVPPLPESITDATLVEWHKQPGEAVARDENLADLETDKVVLEVPAPSNGVMGALKVQSGTTVKAGDLLAVIEEGTAAARSANESQAPTRPQEVSVSAPAEPAAKPASQPPESAPASSGKASPAARRLVEENGLEASTIAPSGRDGRLTKGDVLSYLERNRRSAPAPSSEPSARPAARAGKGARAEQRVAMNRLRQRIAQRLIEAQSTQALLTTFNEVDLTAVMDLRARHKEQFEKREGVKLGLMSFFVRATIEALKRYPVVNASVDGSDIIYHEYYDIGVAVSTERGLIVPIVRDADGKSFGEIEKEIAAYATRAREASIAIEDLTGGTFTITNGGVFGSLLSTPIVNAPQSAILGMHKIQERPMVVDGTIAIRPMMYVALTYDHRIIDGREAVRFLVAVKESLEDPGRMLLGL